MNKAFIKHSTAISPQPSINEEFPWEKVEVYEDKLNCIEPVYKEYFAPMKIRRMSRLVKMALTSAKICLDKAKVEMPDAIITASGWGCLTDTYKYLKDISNKEDITPSPATFIQSTHNTPGGQIALTLGCQNYNNVLVHGNTSFEYAVIDSLMLLNEGKRNVLVGGFDEIAGPDYELKLRAGFWKEEGVKSSEFIQHDSEGTLPGEGAAFLLLSSENSGNDPEIKFCSVLNCPPAFEAVEDNINEALSSYNLSINDIDLVLSGANGNSRNMPLYTDLCENVFSEEKVFHYKQLCGEFDTSSAFAVWLADAILKTKDIPGYILANKVSDIKNILIYNYAGESKHAVTLISKSDI